MTLFLVLDLAGLFVLFLIYAALRDLIDEVRALRRDVRAAGGTAGDADRPA
ncbi:hypothetical protein [Caldinitratiruptor microaerophilus]|uniref:Uncharacterized protein n=1 Tax=Caldinitratiruptor microaerophilus TaxID=671077 RepID=A0AA35CP82_9FIRM|nr:hypothetical protein [Caldinitratiruptor microaerophilus]BDG61106.1 hypothetical protein caldi_21960 [Caldinitratiruptor microaerophilus]